MKKKSLAILLLLLLVSIAQPASAMTTPVFAGMAGSQTNATRFWGYAGGNSPATTDGVISEVMPVSGTVANLGVSLGVSPGTSSSYAITLVKNGSTTGINLTCTVADPSTTCSDFNATDAVTVVAGDTLSWQVVPTGTPAAVNMTFSTTFTGATAGESLIGGTNPGGQSTTTENYYAMYGGNLNATESNVQTLSPISGTIDTLRIKLNSTVTPGGSYTFSLMKNGATTTLACSIGVGGGTQCSDTSPGDAVTISPTDTLTMSTLPVSGPPTRTPTFMVRFRPTTDGESPLWTRSPNLTINGTRFLPSFGQGANNAAEAPYQAIVPAAFTLRNMYVNLNLAPGASPKQWTFGYRDSGATTAITTTITGAAATTGNDLIHSVTIPKGDLVNIIVSSTNSPTAFTLGMISAVMYIAPAALSFSKFRIFGGRFVIHGGRLVIQ